MITADYINTNNLKKAIELSRKEILLFKKFPKLNKWISGDDHPTIRQLEQFSKDTHIPFGYFFLKHLPDISLSIPYFRSFTDDPVDYYSPELLSTVSNLERRQAWLKEYLILKGEKKLPFVGSASVNSNIVELAQSIRETLGLEENWAKVYPNWATALQEIRNSTEEVGINVIENGVVGNNTRLKLNPQEFRGFVLVDKYAPFVFVNGADFKAAKMFTLAHELSHIWLGSSAAFDLRQLLPAQNQTEKFCNAVAAEFLVPEIILRDQWKKIKTDSNPYQKLARYFKVSEIVAARRVLDLKMIEKKQFLDFYKVYSKFQFKKKKETDGGNFYATQTLRIGQQFARHVIQATKEGNLLYREAYKLTGLNGKTFREFEKRMSI